MVSRYLEHLLLKNFCHAMPQFSCTYPQHDPKIGFISINKKFILRYFKIKYESCVTKNECNKSCFRFFARWVFTEIYATRRLAGPHCTCMPNIINVRPLVWEK